MKSKLCLLLLLAAPSLVFAQEHASPKWALGAELGYAAMNVQIIDDIPHTLYPGDAVVTGDPSVGDSGGEGIFAVHAGTIMNSFLRGEALLSINLVGVGFGGSHPVPVSEGTTTTAEFDHGTGSGFLSTGVRFVAEDARSPSAIRPRASLSAIWQWTKGPAAMVSAGFTTGSARTRFTIDAGEQFSWLRYDRVFRTYQTSNNALVAEQRLNGTKGLRGFSVRIGVDHYVF
jgi:hypothetical protein